MTEDHDRQNCLCDACVTWRFNRSSSGRSGQPSGRSRGSGRQSGPPIAKNPANQEYINKCWQQEQERKAAERRERRQSRRQGWQPGGSVDAQDARTKEQGRRTDAIWGGARGNQPGDGHGHVVSKDGLNAEYVRDPGMEHDDYVVNNSDSVVDPYDPTRGKRRRRR